MEWSGNVSEARRLYRCSILNENADSKKQYLLEAAQHYLSASQEASDNPCLRESLVSLSISCISEAERLHEFSEIRTRRRTRTDSIDNTEDSIGFIQQERLLQEIHSRRISGLQQLPKEEAPTSAQVLSDVLTLEKRLAELGVRRPVSTTTAALQSKNNNKAVRYNSSIGESYMVLQDEADPPSSSSQNADQGTHHSMDYSMISLPAVNKQFLHNHHSSAPSPAINSAAANAASVSAAGGGIIPFWSRPSQPTVNIKSTTSIKPSESFVNVMDGLAWNEQSTILTDSSKQADSNTVNNISDIHASISNKTAPDDQMEAINRLLTVISTLKDENDKLSEQNEVITLDMQSFKMEYEEKLHDIRDQLDRVTHEPLPIVAMAEEKGKVNDTTSSDSNAQQLIAAYQVALERAKTKEQRNSERRMTLEKTIFGLLERYKMLEEDVKKKDRALARLRGVAPVALATQNNTRDYTQPSIQQQQQQPPSIRNYHNSQSAPQISGMESSGEGNSPHSESPGSQNNNNRHGHPTAAMAQLGTIHTYNRRQAPAAKHPSVSTLESLQKAQGKTFPK